MLVIRRWWQGQNHRIWHEWQHATSECCRHLVLWWYLPVSSIPVLPAVHNTCYGRWCYVPCGVCPIRRNQHTINFSMMYVKNFFQTMSLDVVLRMLKLQRETAFSPIFNQHQWKGATFTIPSVCGGKSNLPAYKTSTSQAVTENKNCTAECHFRNGQSDLNFYVDSVSHLVI